MKSSAFAFSVWLLNIKFQFLPSVPLFVSLFAAIGFDLITGVFKAKVKGEVITSWGYRQTIKKLAQYFGTLGIVVFLRYIVNMQPDLAAQMKYLDIGISGVLIFSIFIELTSSLENIAEIDKRSPFSRYIIQPLLRLLTFQLKNNPLKRAADETKTSRA